MIRYRFTYDVVTPESAEDGDVAERGFYSPPGCVGGKFDVEGEGNGDYHEDRASAAFRDICATLNGVEHVQSRSGHLTVYGQPYEDPCGGSETIAAHIEAHPRLIAVLARRFRDL